MEGKTLNEEKTQEPAKNAEKEGEENQINLQIEGTTKGSEPLKAEEEKSKPLLDEDSVKIDIKPDKEVGDTPTLPLPTRKNRKDDEKGISSKFMHPLNQMKQAWATSSNVFEFIFKAIGIVALSLGWFFCVGGIPFMSLAMLIVGSIYVHDCSAEPLIPIYLIVAGLFGTLQHFMAVWTKYSQDDEESTPIRKALKSFDGLIQSFLTIWFICGCVWVYGIYEPEYQDRYKTDIYCQKGLYLFAFWLFNFSFIILALLIVVVLITILCFVVAVRSSSSE